MLWSILCLLGIVNLALASGIYLTSGQKTDVLGSAEVSILGSTFSNSLPEPPKPIPHFDSLREVVERPIFSPSRQKRAKRTAPEPLTRPIDLVLAGVIVSGNNRIALVRRPPSGKVMRLSVGQQIDGWLILTIHRDKLVLGAGEGRREILLNDNRLLADPGSDASSISRESSKPAAPERRRLGKSKTGKDSLSKSLRP